nr:MAG TPA: hypothetical protein [Caudoviricetes sp.]DAM01595.1 MAG TPA: hypothetical protein [Caudoviricetes sp.]DAO07008.1 MAG TPA: hypothetical protein [Caudoviricetes sp.]
MDGWVHSQFHNSVIIDSRREAMQEQEKIPVWVQIVNGKTVCICHRGRKGCKKPCEKDVVTRDKFAGWQGVMRRDRFGR